MRETQKSNGGAIGGVYCQADSESDDIQPLVD